VPKYRMAIRRTQKDRHTAPVPVAYESWSYRDLQARAKELGVPARQAKDDLIAGIKKAESYA
jgi:hypothetical protein